MKIQSKRAKEIDAYINNHPDTKKGKWPVEIAGEKKVLSFYSFPIRLLRYNANNGRTTMEIREWEQKNKRTLDACQPDDVVIIRSILLKLDLEKTKVLKEDLRKKGQMEPGVITHDGFVTNGNRRMAVIEELHREEPTGKWEFLEAIRLPPTISERDLWKIEAGLQLSKAKVAEYHPVNELLKIKQGIDAGLTTTEVAAAMYGRTVDEAKDALKRLELIESFLQFFDQSRNYGLIKHFGLHEYFIDIQKSVVAPAKREGLPKRQLAKRLQYSFALIRASVLQNKKGDKKQKGITHWDVRKLGKIFSDVRAEAALLEHLGKAKNLLDVSPGTVIEEYHDGVELISMKEQRYQPVRLIERAIKALESIDRESEHFREERVREEIAKLSKLVEDIERELTEQSRVTTSQ